MHRTQISEANLDNIGRLTLDEDLMDAAGIQPYEKLQVVNAYNGERIETYLIQGERGSGVCCLNGPAARKGMKGDIVIILSYGIFHPAELLGFEPKLIFPKERNRL